MSYTYPIDPQAMFDDREHQFAGFGVPMTEIREMRAAVTDMWADAPGGWPFEWSGLAARHAATGDHVLASVIYGCAKFPCLADQARVRALDLQVKEYLAAAPAFPVHFERRTLSLPYRGRTIDLPVHLLSTTRDYTTAPVLVTSGGVDTWKMDVHPMLVGFAQQVGVTVLAFDHPGTGETPVPLDVHADEVVLGVVREARALGNGRVGHYAASFGANFSAMTGLTGAVDAAIVNGGPIDDSFQPEHLARLPYGMYDIVANAMGFDRRPPLDEFTAVGAGLSRHDLLKSPTNAPMLIINGADDYFVPQSDTLVFEGRPDTEVHLIPGTGHIAMSKMAETMPMMIGWLRKQLV